MYSFFSFLHSFSSLSFTFFLPPTLCFYHVKAILNTIILGPFLYPFRDRRISMKGKKKEWERKGRRNRSKLWKIRKESLFKSSRVFFGPRRSFHPQKVKALSPLLSLSLSFSSFSLSPHCFQWRLSNVHLHWLFLSSSSVFPLVILFLTSFLSFPFTFTTSKEF